MRDVTALVPRTPPKGLREWTEQNRAAELDVHVLVYEAVWIRDWGLAAVMDEGAKPRNIRVVEVRCTCCGETALFDMAHAGRGQFGFVASYEGGEADVCMDGDLCPCPICGCAAQAVRKSRIGKKGFVTVASTQVMSADVVGEDRLLALTGWTAERRVYASGSEGLELIPAEAYVFGPKDCAQLMGWRTGYNPYTGAYVQYSCQWRQPGRWSERWGSEDEIYGLTPELVARSCLPHCKLDVYMTAGAALRPKFPVPYVRFYQTHPNVEALLLHGLPLVLDELMAAEVSGQSWKENCRGLLSLPEIHWEEARPAQMLGLTREELRLGRQQCWGLLLWRLFSGAKTAGELLTEADMTRAFELGDDNVCRLIGRGPVGKSLRYLLSQMEAFGVEPEDEDPDPNAVVDVSILLDYWTMAAALGRDLSDPAVRFPPNLADAHNVMTALTEARTDSALAALFRVRRRQLSKWTFQADGLLIRPAASQQELVTEGDILHHCVKTYAKRHADGRTAIFFIRRADSPKTPWYTLELDEKQLEVRQNRGRYNCGRTPEVEAFETLWLRWLRQGAPRDARGRPVTGNSKGQRLEVAS